MDEQPKAPEDAYEAKYMEGGAALAHAKKRMPWWFFALLGLGPTILTLTAVLQPSNALKLLPGLAISLVLTSVAALLLSHLRVVVTKTHLHVQYGLWGPKIALEDIVELKAGDYDWKRFGGWGLRLGRNGEWCYSIPGGSGQCVEVAWKTPEGKEKRIVVSADNAAELVAAADLARAQRGLSNVRVDAADQGSAGEADEAAAATVERKARRE